MRTTLSPRWAANELERLVVYLTADDLEQLVWDGALEQSYPLGHTVRIEVFAGDSPQEGEEPNGGRG